MSNNLINIFAFVKKNFQDFNIIYGTPPSFLKTLLNAEEKIIFFCKISDYGIVSYQSPKKNEKKLHPNIDTMDLTGSPLKDDCNMDALNFSIDLQLKTASPWNTNEEKFQPIELEKIRSVISDKKLQKEALNTSSIGSIWFLCKATDQDNTILISLNFESDYNSIGFVKYYDLVEASHICIDKLMSLHKSFLKSVNQTETFVENFYYIKQNIYLKLSWSTIAARPQLINLKNCSTMLCQEINLEGNDSVMEYFWRQLSLLNLINEDIIKFRNNNLVGDEITYKWGSGVETDILREQIIEAMTELPCYYGGNENDSNEIEAVVTRTKNRPLTDITDKLWEILKCCSSYTDLKMGFTNVFQCAAQRNIINMPINKNSLAKIIGDVSQQRLAIPCLTGSEPLELLLEIGLEKLEKDYEYILTESNICGLSDLQRLQNSKPNNLNLEENCNVRCTLSNAIQKFPTLTKNRTTLLHNSQNTQSKRSDNESIGFQNSKYNEMDAEFKLAKLSQIHIALEHLLFIQINLSLKNVYKQIFEQLLQRPLQNFPSSLNKFSDSIAIPILTENIQCHVENKNPNVRRIVVSSSNKFKEVKSTFYYNMENIYPPNILNSVFDICEEKLSNKAECYFHSMYVCIKTKRL